MEQKCQTGSAEFSARCMLGFLDVFGSSVTIRGPVFFPCRLSHIFPPFLSSTTAIGHLSSRKHFWGLGRGQEGVAIKCWLFSFLLMLTSVVSVL